MPSDIQEVLESWLSVPGVSFVSSDAKDGRPVFFKKAGPELWSDLERHDHLHVAGPFTVDLQLSPSKVFVLEQSGPLLYLRVPGVFVNGLLWRSPRDPETPVELKEGYLGLHSAYFYSRPAGRLNPMVEVNSAFRKLAALGKSKLVRHEGRWIGKAAKRWLVANEARLRG